MEYKILIVDDNDLIREQIINSLNKTKHDITFFQSNNGNVGFDIAMSRVPDIILTDWEMPECDGIELIHKIKAEKILKQIPIIMITGVNVSSDDIETVLDAGAFDYVRKPIDSKELVARIFSAIRLHEANSEIIRLINKKIVDSGLFLLQKSNTINEISRKLKILYSNITDKSKIADIYLDIKAEIQKSSEENTWLEFENTFLEHKPKFKDKLLKVHPNLTPSQIKLCMLIHLETSPDETASLLQISAGSLKISRTRLRKNLGIVSSKNLKKHLGSI